MHGREHTHLSCAWKQKKQDGGGAACACSCACTAAYRAPPDVLSVFFTEHLAQARSLPHQSSTCQVRSSPAMQPIPVAASTPFSRSCTQLACGRAQRPQRAMHTCMRSAPARSTRRQHYAPEPEAGDPSLDSRMQGRAHSNTATRHHATTPPEPKRPAACLVPASTPFTTPPTEGGLFAPWLSNPL